ncbi:hypothetical protein BAS10_08560 [Elizabethkingia meningoseptica]|nr:hypothetical protein BAS10_08560 [Elizabethkingia meningoseptica]
MYNEVINLSSVFTYEAGYKALMFLFKQIGFDFQNFFKIISFIILMILGIFTLKFSKYPALFIGVFLLAYLPIQYVLLRNFLAFSIVLLGIMYYLNGGNKRKYILLLSIFAATTIHISSLFYFLVYFAFVYPTLKLSKIVFYIILGVIIFSIFNSFILPKLIGNVGGRDTLYLTNFPQFLLFSVYQIINYIMIKWYFKNNTSIESNHINLLIKMNMYLLFLIIIYFNYAIFIRIFLNLSLINVLFMLNTINIKKENGIQRGLVLVVYILFFFMEFIYPVNKDSLIPLYNKNLIFNE